MSLNSQEGRKAVADESRERAELAEITTGITAKINKSPMAVSGGGAKLPKGSAISPDEDLPSEDEEVLDELEVEDAEEAAEEIDDELPLDAVLVATDTSERIILVVDEEGQRRNETLRIIQHLLPNAVIETANDPEEAMEMMGEGDFDTFVVNFLMPGYSSSHFVKAVCNHPDHPLLIGFAADKMSDAVDPKKGLKVVPLKRLFDLDATADAAAGPAGEKEEE